MALEWKLTAALALIARAGAVRPPQLDSRFQGSALRWSWRI